MIPVVAIAQIVLESLKYGSQFATAIVALLHKPQPTEADWLAALALAKTPFTAGLHEGAIQPDK